MFRLDSGSIKDIFSKYVFFIDKLPSLWWLVLLVAVHCKLCTFSSVDYVPGLYNMVFFWFLSSFENKIYFSIKVLVRD